jgi:hypothetical protein
MRAAGCHVQIVDDRADHVGVLDRSRDSMAVVDEEPEAEHDEYPGRDQRDLRDERRLRILMRDEEDEADVHERAHEHADRDLGDPVLQEPVEQSGAKQRRDHRQYQQRDRENQREHSRDRAHHRSENRTRIVDAAHRQPRRDVNVARLVENVGNQSDPEQPDWNERELQRYPP